MSAILRYLRKGIKMFNQTEFVKAFVADITGGLNVGDKLKAKLAAGIEAAGVEGRKQLQKALYAACRKKSERHYAAARKLWQMAIGIAEKKAPAKTQNAELVKFLLKAARQLSKGGDGFPAEVFAMLVDCQLEYENPGE